MIRRLSIPIRLTAAIAVLGVIAACGLIGAGRSSAAGSSSATGTATGLSLISEPQSGVTPFLAMIAGAHSSIDLTMYELSDPRIEAALASAAQRGVDVRVLLNGGYYRDPDSDNRAASADLAAHGVHVRSTPTYFALTHQKTLTVDGRESAVMTLNFDGEYASTRDYAILDRQPADISAITAVFDADWDARAIVPSRGTGDLVWSPGAQTRVLDLIAAARTSIDLENEKMAYAPATAALCAAARRGVAVEVVMTYASDWRSAFDQLIGCGVRVRVYHGQSYYIHAKLLEVDGRRALVSSQNLSATSLEDNRELGIDVSTPSLVRALTQDFSDDYAGAAAFSRSSGTVAGRLSWARGWASK